MALESRFPPVPIPTAPAAVCWELLVMCMVSCPGWVLCLVAGLAASWDSRVL